MYVAIPIPSYEGQDEIPEYPEYVINYVSQYLFLLTKVKTLFFSLTAVTFLASRNTYSFLRRSRRLSKHNKSKIIKSVAIPIPSYEGQDGRASSGRACPGRRNTYSFLRRSRHPTSRLSFPLDTSQYLFLLTKVKTRKKLIFFCNVKNSRNTYSFLRRSRHFCG